MVLIKLNVYQKIAGIGIMILLAVIFLVFAIGVVPNNVDPAKVESIGKDKTSTEQSYMLDTQDEYVETTENTTITGDIIPETEEPTEATEIIEEETEVEESTVIEETVTVEEITMSDDNEAVEENLYTKYYTEQDTIDIAKVLYSECRGVSSKTEQACVAWIILNRVDCYGSTVYSVVRSPGQFVFHEGTPVWDDLLNLAHDVLYRWNQEKNGEINTGRVLPREYIYFTGRDGHNYFRDSYSGSYNIWDYSLKSPYES